MQQTPCGDIGDRGGWDTSQKVLKNLSLGTESTPEWFQQVDRGVPKCYSRVKSMKDGEKPLKGFEQGVLTLVTAGRRDWWMSEAAARPRKTE